MSPVLKACFVLADFFLANSRQDQLYYRRHPPVTSFLNLVNYFWHEINKCVKNVVVSHLMKSEQEIEWEEIRQRHWKINYFFLERDDASFRLQIHLRFTMIFFFCLKSKKSEGSPRYSPTFYLQICLLTFSTNVYIFSRKWTFYFQIQYSWSKITEHTKRNYNK